MDRRTEIENSNLDWLNLDDLIEFIDNLRAEGYKIDISQYIAAQDLILMLIAQGETLDSPERLRNLLAPIFCSSPTEQEKFQQHFDSWVQVISQTISEESEENLEVETLIENDLQSNSHHLIAVLIFMSLTGIILFIALKVSQQNTPTVTSTDIPTITPTNIAIITPTNTAIITPTNTATITHQVCTSIIDRKVYLGFVLVIFQIGCVFI